jgi:exopolysaccharide biosynthesis polyprenyl glycosylphosphotransferase
MYRRHGDKLALVFLGCDLAVTAGVWLGAYFVRFSLLPSPMGVPEPALVLDALPAVLLLAAIAYRVCGLYEVHRLRQLPRELGVVCRASGLLFLMAVAIIFYRRDLYESRLALCLFLVLNAVGLMLVRRLIWRVLKYFRGRGLNYGRALIVGTGRTGRQVARAIRNNGWTGLEAVGFVDRHDRRGTALLPWLGTIDDLARIVVEHDVDHVFVALPLSRFAELPLIYRALTDVLVDIQLVPEIPNLAGMRIRMVDIDNLTFLGLRQNPQYGWARAAKRATDVIVASLALVLLGPLMALLAAAIKWTSPGPVFYRQTRIGLQGQTFQMLKFRSMRVDAERETGPVWAVRGDGRCTPLGRFMRRTSLDELPQLFNVLVGDMSLVGPRPEREVFVEKFRRQIPGYTQRHRVKAGMTGWAQVNGWRGCSSLRHRVQCDLYYIANWSLGLDLKILALTVLRVIRPRNAY